MRPGAFVSAWTIMARLLDKAAIEAVSQWVYDDAEHRVSGPLWRRPVSSIEFGSSDAKLGDPKSRIFTRPSRVTITFSG